MIKDEEVQLVTSLICISALLCQDYHNAFVYPFLQCLSLLTYSLQEEQREVRNIPSSLLADKPSFAFTET